MRLAGIVDNCSGPMNVGSSSRNTRRFPPGMLSIARAVSSMYLIVTQHTAGLNGRRPSQRMYRLEALTAG